MSGIVGSRLNNRGSGLVGSLGTDGQVFTSSGAGAGAVYETVSAGITQANFRPNSRPLLYNGDMAVAQRAISVTGITNGSSGYHTVDRWRWSEAGAPTVVHTMTLEALTADEAFEDGFATAIKLDVTTADASLAIADYIILEQRLEGFDVQLIKKGTSAAEILTLAFWIKSTKTGTLIAELFDTDNGRNCSVAYTISSSDTWEFKVLNFPADTTGAFGNDKNESLTVKFWLGAGTNFTSGTLATAWESQNNVDRAVGCINTTDSTSNNVHITGVQLEIGEYTSSTLPPFQHESMGDNTARCKRYYHELFPYGKRLANTRVGIGQSQDENDHEMVHHLPVEMRTPPSIGFPSINYSTQDANFYSLFDYAAGAKYSSANAVGDSPSVQRAFTKHTHGSDVWLVGGAVQMITVDTVSNITFNAEL